jgi:hypothetical protein
MTEVIERANGVEPMERKGGRRVPPLPVFEFATGYSIKVRPVGLLTQQQIMRAINEEWEAAGDGEPQPPIVDTPLGKEVNRADEKWEQEREQWARRFNLEYHNRLLRYGALEAEFEIDADLLARTRRRLSSVGIQSAHFAGLEPDEQDKIDFFFYCIATDQDDVRNFYTFLINRSLPTREAVERHKATFPGDVQGKGD